MWKERFGTMRRDPKTGNVKVIFVDGYADGCAFCYYKLGSKWHAILSAPQRINAAENRHKNKQNLLIDHLQAADAVSNFSRFWRDLLFSC